MYIDINVLQTVPASNLNRDETGAPKTAIYGGVTRARVSSQSWKHAMRQAFGKDIKNTNWLKGIRTMKNPQLVKAAIQKLDDSIDDDTAMLMALNIFKAGKIKTKDDKTAAMLMLSKRQIKALAQLAVDHQDAFAVKKFSALPTELKNELKGAFKDHNSADIALFGRMVADDPSLSVDAAAQVAHAISTHEIVPEFDYFTAVDDAKGTNEDAGAGMIGTIEYDSSTLYRYANVNIDELMYNLNSPDAAGKALQSFIKSFVMSMPTGKQNTFANKTVPQYVMVTVRPDTPVNLVSAFENPVTAENGYVDSSINALEAEYEKVGAFAEKPIATYVLTTAKTSLTDDAVKTLPELLSKIEEAVKPALEEGADDEDLNN